MMNVTPLRAIIWVAVSTKQQTKEGKESLSEQEQLARAVCEDNGWQIIDVLRVPGHSRRYIDIHKLADVADKSGIDAFKRLLDHFEQRDFDLLVVRDGDRFARTQTLHSMIVETTITIVKAKIYSLTDGFIDEHNFRMFISMGGYRAAGVIDKLIKAREMGYKSRLKRGLPMGYKPIDPHILIRDEKNGKQVRVELNEDKYQEYLDLATVVLEGISWGKIEKEMFKRFGYGIYKGDIARPHPTLKYYKVIQTPVFWGHSAIGYYGKKYGLWIYEDGHTVPDGVTIDYDNPYIPAVYQGALADEVKVELKRRRGIIGSRKPHNSYPLSGLVICGECGYSMSYSTDEDLHYIRCQSPYRVSHIRPDCSNRLMMRAEDAYADIEPFLDLIAELGSVESFVTGDTSSQDLSDLLQTLDAKIADIETQIETMIFQQAKAPDNLQESFNKSLRATGNQLEALKTRRNQVRSDIALSMSHQTRGKDAIATYEDLRQNIWQLDGNKVNQILSAILGDYKFVSKDRHIIGIIPQ